MSFTLDLPYHSNDILFLHLNSGRLRGFIADYGVPVMVVLWTAVSYIMPDDVPNGVPRRLFCPLPWEPASLYHWTVVKVLYVIILHYKFSIQNAFF